jgi:hypothetical protein
MMTNEEYVQREDLLLLHVDGAKGVVPGRKFEAKFRSFECQVTKTSNLGFPPFLPGRNFGVGTPSSKL